jgi:hypothetical protein
MKNLFSIKQFRGFITPILLAFFLLSITHNLFHNSFDHAHDSSCSVYVLEEFFTATDPIHLYKDVLVESVYLDIDLSKELHPTQTFKHYTIRAPPANFFLS